MNLVQCILAACEPEIVAVLCVAVEDDIVGRRRGGVCLEDGRGSKGGGKGGRDWGWGGGWNVESLRGRENEGSGGGNDKELGNKERGWQGKHG